VRSPTASHHYLLEGLSTFNGNHLFDAGKRDDGISRNSRSRGGLIGNDFCFHKRARPEAPAISHVGFNREHTVLLTDRRTQSFDETEVSIRITLDSYAYAL